MTNLGLIEKISNLPPQRVSEVEDFVDFLAEKDAVVRTNGSKSANLRDLGIEAAEAAEQRAALFSFVEDWERPEMDVYDKL